MSESCLNIYQFGRKSAGLTQQRAAELLGCSQRALSDHERGIALNSTIAMKMAEAYDFPLLPTYYLMHDDLCGRKYLPGAASLEKLEPRTYTDVHYLLSLVDNDARTVLDTMTALRRTPGKHQRAGTLSQTLRAVSERSMVSAAFLDARYGDAS